MICTRETTLISPMVFSGPTLMYYLSMSVRFTQKDIGTQDQCLPGTERTPEIWQHTWYKSEEWIKRMNPPANNRQGFLIPWNGRTVWPRILSTCKEKCTSVSTDAYLEQLAWWIESEKEIAYFYKIWESKPNKNTLAIDINQFVVEKASISINLFCIL